jgi:AmmeMemoRadiSam system protein A
MVTGTGKDIWLDKTETREQVIRSSSYTTTKSQVRRMVRLFRQFVQGFELHPRSLGLPPRRKGRESLTGGAIKAALISGMLSCLMCTAVPGAAGWETGTAQLDREAGPTHNRKGDGNMGTAKRLSEDEGKYLLDLARKTIGNRLSNSEPPRIDPETVPQKFQERLGTFVTVTIDGNLRGCIGHIIPRETLIEGIRENAINAAFRDPRFSPLTQEEFDEIQLEISVLTLPQELTYTDAKDLLNKLRPGVDGVIIKKGYHEATFLPQVWDQLPDKKEFLTHLCLKAGLSPHSWKTEKLVVSTYQVQAFEEEKAE